MRKIFFLSILLFSNYCFSCQTLEGEIQINTKKIPVLQKCLKDITYSFTNNPYFIHLKLNGHILDVKIDQLNTKIYQNILSTQLMFQEKRELEFSALSKENDIKLNLKLTQI